MLFQPAICLTSVDQPMLQMFPAWQNGGILPFVQVVAKQGWILRMRHEELMANWQAGDGNAGHLLLRDIYQELEKIAAAKLAREFHSSLSTGDLINESVIRLSKLKQMEFQSREHIMALASRIMRQVLVDQARRRNRDKRYHTQVTLVTNAGYEDASFELLELDFVLDDLRQIDPVRADIVEMRYFGGMTLDDMVVVLDISKATIKRRWQGARIWLQERLGA